MAINITPDDDLSPQQPAAILIKSKISVLKDAVVPLETLYIKI